MDFKLNPALVDSPGRIISILTQSAPNDFWDALQDSQKDRAIAVRLHKDQGTKSYSRSFLVSPTALVFNWEAVEGVAGPDLIDDAAFKELLNLSQEVCEEFKIQDIRRAGLRLWSYASPRDFHAKNVLRLLDARLETEVSEVLGPISDVGIAFDGGADKHAKYHIKFGPCVPSEIESKSFFEDIGEQFSKSFDTAFVLDIDQYEENFSLKGRRWVSWVRFQVESFIKTEVKLMGLLLEEDAFNA